MLTLNISRNAGSGLAAATTSAQVCVGVLVSGVSRVEPEHVGVVVIPQRHDKYHTLGKSFGHVSLTTLVLIGVCVFECCFLLVAEFGGDGVAVNTRNRGCRLSNGLSALDIEALNLHSVTGTNELGDNGKLLRSVNSHALAVEILDTHAVAVEITAVRVAYASIAVCGVCSTTTITVAAGLLDGAASMGRHRRADGVGFPDIHLGAARAVTTDTGVRVVRGCFPAFYITLESGLVIETIM
jgi:hypothetical protein